MGNHRAKGGFIPSFFRRVQVALQVSQNLGHASTSVTNLRGKTEKDRP